MPEVSTSTSRGLLAASTDPRMTGWVTQLFIGLGFTTQALLASLATDSPLSTIPAAVVAWVAQWGLSWIVYRLFLGRPWWRRHVRSSVLVLLILITVIAIVVTATFPSTADGWSVLWRLVITLVVTALVVTLIDYRDDVGRERQAQQRLQRARSEGFEMVQSARQEIVQRMLDMLAESFDATSADTDASERLRRFAADQVRPLSHELAEAMPVISTKNSTHSVRQTWMDALGEITARPLLRPLLMAISVTVLFVFTTVEVTSRSDSPTPSNESSIAVNVDLGSLLLSFASLGLVFLTTWLGAWLATRITTPLLPRLSLRARIGLAIATVVLIAGMVVIVVEAIVSTLQWSSSGPGSLAQRLWLAVPIVGIAFAIVVIRSITETINQSRRRMQGLTEQLEWETARLENTLMQERQFYATQIHGPIQSAVAAAALRLESGNPSGETLEQVRLDLESAVHALAEGPPERRDVNAEMVNLIDTWSGVCAVSVSIPEPVQVVLARDWVAGGTALDLVTEAVANAAMHGGAQNAWITMDFSDVDELLVEVVNDGHGELGGDRGLGTAMLDSIAVRWARVTQPEGVRLEIVLAVPDRQGALVSP